MSLTVCLLTRNDAQTVARAIESVRGVADEVLVADTASTDGTAQTAADAGATVTQFAWEDDFAAGRNYLIGRATGDWVLWLDAKEELAAESVTTVREAIAQREAFGWFVKVFHVAETDDEGGGSSGGRRVVAETADLRLFRKRPDLRFVGRLHPHFEAGVAEAVKRDGLTVGPSEIVLRHCARHERPTEAKLRWTARLLELELRDRPGQLHYLIEQARTLLLLRDPRGHHVMAAAADLVLATRDAQLPPSAKVQVLLQHVLSADAADAPRLPLDADTARELALRWFPSSPRLLWTLAEQRFRAGEYERAAHLLERLVRLGKTGTFDRSQAFSPELVGERAVMNLGTCYLKLNRPAQAEACFVQILASPSLGTAAARQLEAARRMKA